MNCKCIAEIEDKLRPTHPQARINTSFTFPDMNEMIVVEFTYQPENLKRKKVGTLVIGFCPFCGKAV